MSVSKSFVLATLVAGVASSTQIKMTPYKQFDSVEKCTKVSTTFLPETTFTSGVCKELASSVMFDKSARVTLEANGTSIKWEYSKQSKTCENLEKTATIPLDTCYDNFLNWLKFEKVDSSSPAPSVGVAAVLTAVVARLLF